MSTVELKSSIYELVNSTRDSKLLTLVYKILSAKKTNVDFWDTLTVEQKEEIELSLKDLEEGKGIPHEEVMAKYKGKYI